MYETTLNNMYIWSFYEYACILCEALTYNFSLIQLKNALIYMLMYTEFTYKEE